MHNSMHEDEFSAGERWRGGCHLPLNEVPGEGRLAQ